MTRVGFLGPHGTFAEEALLTQPDLAAGEAVPFRDVPHVITAVERFKHEIPKDATCVVILPDRGERYLDTIYSDTWVKEHFGDVSHLWEITRAAA